MTGLTLALSILTAVIGTASAAGEEAPGARVPPSQIVLYDASPFFFARGGRGGFAAIEGRLSCACAQRFGSRAQFRTLVRAAHARGLRVLLDMAANHLSDESPYYRDAQRRGRRSSYYDRFERDGSGRALHYFDWTRLENRMRPGRCANAIRTSGRGCARALRVSIPTSHGFDAAYDWTSNAGGAGSACWRSAISAPSRRR